MKLTFTKCLWASILLGLAQFSYPPTDVGDVGEYLRVLKALKAGTMKMPDLNDTAQPWNYTSQGLEFERKLKQIHGSRIAASQPKKHLLAPPVLIEKEDDAPGLGFLDYLGIFTLVGGSLAAISLACCCWIKCSSNTGTLGPL